MTTMKIMQSTRGGAALARQPRQRQRAAEPLLAPHGARPFLPRLDIVDWLFALALALVLGAGYAFVHYNAHMDYYDKAVLVGTV
ncbi:hypothetical protein WM03_06420, partial [Burkholderia ubonensis]